MVYVSANFIGDCQSAGKYSRFYNRTKLDQIKIRYAKNALRNPHLPEKVVRLKKNPLPRTLIQFSLENLVQGFSNLNILTLLPSFFL